VGDKSQGNFILRFRKIKTPAKTDLPEVPRKKLTPLRLIIRSLNKKASIF